VIRDDQAEAREGQAGRSGVAERLVVPSTAICGARAMAGRAVGYNGVTVWNPQGKLIGRIRLPEVTANVCFGGPDRSMAR
jgi:hypothetical protein